MLIVIESIYGMRKYAFLLSQIRNSISEVSLMTEVILVTFTLKVSYTHLIPLIEGFHLAEALYESSGNNVKWQT